VSWQTCRCHISVEEIREYPEAQQPFRLMEKILIVEDDQAVQKALKRLFESTGYAVEITGDGGSALEAFRSATPTAIVLDLRLPVLSGKDVCLLIRQQLSTLPIIILSASTDVVDKIMLLELGADDYVTKPFSSQRAAGACAGSDPQFA
jgi:DNA-binding response OmpR family regulator